MAMRSEQRLRDLKARFDRPMLIASIAVLIGMSLRVMFTHHHPLHLVGDWLIRAAWFAFLAEWVVLLHAAPQRGRFLREHRFLTLVIAVGPLALAVNLIWTLPGIEALSAALLLAPLGRWLLNRGSLRYLFALGALIVLVATIAFWRVEDTTFGQALYWSTTAITVGPEGPNATVPETMFLTAALGFLGVGFFGAIIGGFISMVLQREQAALELETREELGGELEEIEEQVEDAAQQSEVDNAMLAAKLDEVMARIAALEARLPPPDR